MFCLLLPQRERPYRERSASLDRWWRGEEAEVAVADLIKSTQVLDDRNVGGEENCVRRAHGILHVVDVGAIDADQRCSAMYEVVAGCRGEKRSGAEIVRRPPVHRPVGVDENGFAADGEAGQDAGLDRSVGWRRDHDALEVGELLEGNGGEDGLVAMTMEGRVVVSAGIAAEIVAGDLKRGAWGIFCLARRIIVRKESMKLGYGKSRV